MAVVALAVAAALAVVGWEAVSPVVEVRVAVATVVVAREAVARVEAQSVEVALVGAVLAVEVRAAAVLAVVAQEAVAMAEAATAAVVMDLASSAEGCAVAAAPEDSLVAVTVPLVMGWRASVVQVVELWALALWQKGQEVVVVARAMEDA